MKYKISRADERCRIVEDTPDVFEVMQKPRPNLENNEFQIAGLITPECPKRLICVSLDRQGFSSICTHKLISPAMANSDAVSCGLKNGKELSALLKAANCPLKRSDCLSCDMFRHYHAPSCWESLPLKKSHAYVRCGAFEKPVGE